MPGKRVAANEIYYEEPSQTLVFHGHQLDYNRIFRVNGQKISCIDGLTVALNNFVAQTPSIEERVRLAAEKGNFSYWYAFGKLPKFIRAVEKIFGAKPGLYTRDCARVIRGGDLDQWLAQQSDLQVKVVGWLAKQVALYPPALLWLYTPFSFLLNLKTSKRTKKILMGKEYTDKPEEFKGHKRIKRLVTGHYGDPRRKKYRGKGIYSISYCRISTLGVKNGLLKTFRDFDYVLLDSGRVSSYHKRIAKDITVAPENFCNL